MPNKIKTSGSTTKLTATRNTNFKIGVDTSDDYGPTNASGFYNGITPPLSGYTIYVHRNSGGPSIHVAYDDNQCVFFLKSFGATGETITEVINWSTGRTDIWVQTSDLTPSDLGISKNTNDELVTIAQYLRNYMSDFRNPSFYAYQLDGNGFNISDGGFDMYDSGNITSPWLTSNVSYTGSSQYSLAMYPSAINYQNSETTTTLDTSFNYISLGYQQFTGTQSLTYLPLTVLGTRNNSIYGDGLPIGFQSGGNSGADGGGTLAANNIYTGNTVSGFTVHSYYRQTYAAGDPSHCDLFILLGHSNWNSVFGTVIYNGAPVNQGSNGSALYTTGAGTKNILAIKTLLSKSSGAQVTFNECKTVVDNFIIRIKESQGF